MDESIADLISRSTSFRQAGDRDAVLDEHALAEAVRLFGELGDSHEDGDDLFVFCVVAMFLWCHAQAGGPPDGLVGLSELMMLKLFGLAESGTVPARLQPLADAVLRDTMLDSQGRHGLNLLDHGINDDDSAALDAGIEIIRSVLAESGERLAINDDCRVRLSIGLWQRSRNTGHLGDLDEAVSVGTAVVARLAGRGRARFAAAFASMLAERYEATGNQKDLERVINLCLVEADRLDRADEFGIELRTILRDTRLALFEVSGDLGELDEVIRLGEILTGSVKGEDRAQLSAAQAEAFTIRFGQRGSTSDRDDAIIFRRRAADLFGSGPGWFSAMLALRDQLMGRWVEESRSADLDELITLDAALIPELTSEERLMLLPAHIRLRWDRLNRHGSREDLDMIIEAAREVARLRDPPASKDLSDLCFFLQLRYRQTRDLADLHEAVAAGRLSAQDPPTDPELRATHLSNLFGAVTLLAEATGSPDSFTEAVEVAERAAGLLPADNSAYLANLISALWGRFQATGDRDDLDRSIACGQRALDATRSDDPRASELRASLVVALTMKFHRYDDDTALDQALAVLRQGIDPSPGWIQSLHGLIDALTQRLDRESGPDSGPEEHRSGDLIRLEQIRDGLLNLYEQGLTLISTQMMGDGAATANLELVDGALELLGQAAELGGDRRQAVYLGLRGEILIRRWQITKARGDLDTAINLLIQSASDPPDTEHDRALAGHHRNSAATALLRRFRRRHHREDLQEAERQLELAMALVPASETELHDDMRARLKHTRAVIASAPFLVVHSDVGEADREGLSSPYGHANLQAWNRGRPRFSGLAWVHIREDEADHTSDPTVI